MRRKTIYCEAHRMKKKTIRTDTGKDLFDPKTAEKYLGVRIGASKQWRYNESGPPYVKAANGRVLYRRADLDAFKAAQGTPRRGSA